MSHAPDHLRAEFLDLIEGLARGDDIDRSQLHALCGQLWHCTDTVPGGYAELLDLRAGTYASFARRLMPGSRDPKRAAAEDLEYLEAAERRAGR